MRRSGVSLLADVERLIASKDALFPHDQRAVVSASVRLEGSEVRVTAAALAAPAQSVVGR
jgi:hypothetical protein